MASFQLVQFYLYCVALLISCLFLLANTESVQFCKSGRGDTAAGDIAEQEPQINFCMGMTIHQNASTSSYDLYLSFTIQRENGSSHGWTAIGPGRIMADALMFIVYGDPRSNLEPVVSIRTSPSGHHQPKLVEQTDAGAADLRVLQASWLEKEAGDESDMYEAAVSLVCYACASWPGVTLEPLSVSQPWIWAWNPSQVFPVYSYDAHLLMHKHHANTGGWGNFYVDSASTLNTGRLPSMPTIRPDILTVGASETPLRHGVVADLETLVASPSLHLHGVLMSVSFIFLFPLGVVMMRSASPTRAYQLHWTIQVAAGVLTLLGLLSGLLLRPRLDTVHQFVGIILVLTLGVQMALGWRHHLVFLALHRRTWISHVHIYLGRILLLAGGGNLLAGMALRQYSQRLVVITGVVISLLFTGLMAWLWRVETLRRRNRLSATRYMSVASESDGEGDEHGKSVLP